MLGMDDNGVFGVLGVLGPAGFTRVFEIVVILDVEMERFGVWDACAACAGPFGFERGMEPRVLCRGSWGTFSSA